MTTPPLPLELVIVEDDPNIRELLRILLDGSPGFYCQRNYADGESLLANLDQVGNCLILMDIDLGKGIDGIETLQLIKKQRPELDVIMLTVQEDSDSVFAALCAGAVGYLIKGIAPVKLLAAISDAASGGSPMSPSIARRVVQTFYQNKEDNLSKREREVLSLLCEGESYRGIADQLFISGHTVRSHIKNIYQKLHVNSRAEAVVKAIRENMV